MPASAAKQNEVAQRRAKALRLRATGLGYEEIAQQCGLKTAAAACQDVTRALKDRKTLLEREAAYYVELEQERLDTLQRTLELAIRQTPDTDEKMKIVDRLMRLSQRRGTLLGFDARGVQRPAQYEDELAKARRRRDEKLRGLG
jgi:hypothetical protein